MIKIYSPERARQRERKRERGFVTLVILSLLLGGAAVIAGMTLVRDQRQPSKKQKETAQLYNPHFYMINEAGDCVLKFSQQD